jgi:hypothetical protein
VLSVCGSVGPAPGGVKPQRGRDSSAIHNKKDLVSRDCSGIFAPVCASNALRGNEGVEDRCPDTMDVIADQ